LNPFDNLYYELCNEPYFGGVTLAWQRHMADVIVETERDLPRQHLISRNVANGKEKVTDPHPAVSVFNFHYATPPETVAMNYGLNKVIGDNETGFNGQEDSQYRMEGWEFILAGGALYNNLDYSFAVGYEDGTFEYPENQPGGGSPALRQQLEYLTDFIHSFEFVRMKPDRSFIKGGVADETHVYALTEAGEQYAVYFFGSGPMELEVALPEGNYRVEWMNPVSGEVDRKKRVEHGGGERKLGSPAFDPDVALRIKRVEE
jgi:hypothetical protein